MPLPGVPLSTSKVNSTPSVNDHPAHHDAIATAINAASTALDLDATEIAALQAAVAAIVSQVVVTAFPYRNAITTEDFYADALPLARKITGVNSALVQGVLEELAATIAALVGTGTGLLSYYYVNPNSGSYALAVGTTSTRLTDGTTPVVFPDFVVPASGDIKVTINARTGSVSSPTNPKLALIDNTNAAVGGKKFLITTSANTRVMLSIVALNIGTPGDTITGWGIGGEVASGTEALALDGANGPFYAEIVALP